MELEAIIGFKLDLGENLMIGFLIERSGNWGCFWRKGLNLRRGEEKGRIFGGSLKKEVASMRE